MSDTRRVVCGKCGAELIALQTHYAFACRCRTWPMKKLVELGCVPHDPIDVLVSGVLARLQALPVLTPIIGVQSVGDGEYLIQIMRS